MAKLDQNIDFEIIWRKIHDQTTEEEEILLKSWLSRHSSHRKYYEDAIRYYSNGTQFANSPAELKKALKTIHRKTGIHSPYLNYQIIAITSIAASILILIYFQFLRTGNNPEPPKIEQLAQSIVPAVIKQFWFLPTAPSTTFRLEIIL